MQGAGVQLVNWFAVACELHRDWRNDIEGLGSPALQPHPELPQPHDQLLRQGEGRGLTLARVSLPRLACMG